MLPGEHVDQQRQAAGEVQDHICGVRVGDPAVGDELPCLGVGERRQRYRLDGVELGRPLVDVERAAAADDQRQVGRQVAQLTGEELAEPQVEELARALVGVEHPHDRPGCRDLPQRGDQQRCQLRRRGQHQAHVGPVAQLPVEELPDLGDGLGAAAGDAVGVDEGRDQAGTRDQGCSGQPGLDARADHVLPLLTRCLGVSFEGLAATEVALEPAAELLGDVGAETCGQDLQRLGDADDVFIRVSDHSAAVRDDRAPLLEQCGLADAAFAVDVEHESLADVVRVQSEILAKSRQWTGSADEVLVVTSAKNVLHRGRRPGHAPRMAQPVTLIRRQRIVIQSSSGRPSVSSS
ncbi:hypothetical protein ABZS66_38395 [Dactylosporangium sp. NPDC005572]|uniref:hypothetical protein n=1 Tax=Dactylosporangium sp. NPDC005572 TaxID=3156889 RepID=UPI0033B8F14C